MRKGSKNRRHNLSQEEGVPVDRLSDLPDSVLAHVLCFLPNTDEVVRSSILSKRWKNLWTCVNTLIFEDKKNVVLEKMQYAQFVYMVLRCHSGSIKKMTIASPKEHNDYDIRNWVSSAIDKCVQVLDLRPRDLTPWWPPCLFNSKTLVDLEINGQGVNIINLTIPYAPFFPCLKKLNIHITKWETEALQRLVFGCLVLEDLQILMIFDNISLNLSSPTLKRLVVKCKRIVNNLDHKIELTVPALESVKVRAPPTELVLEDELPFLTEVDIDIFRKPMTDVNENLCCDSLVRFMEYISNVKVLRLNCEFKKPLATLAVHARFPNLTKLEILSSFFEWDLLRSFMETSDNLEFIHFRQKCGKKKDNPVFWIAPQNMPHCLISSLRKISIRGDSIENVLDMVHYVLKNAEVLERMDIDSEGCNGGDYKAKYEILQKLVMMKRAFKGCEISFV